MVNKKTRRHSGRECPNSTLLHEMTKFEIISECFEPQIFWNDWNDYRDGFRDIRDRTLLHRYKSKFGNWNNQYWRDINIQQDNIRIKNKLKIRKAMKHD